MTYKQIEQTRQTRLFITNVIFPTIIAGILLWKNEKVRSWVKTTWNKVKSKFKKGKSKTKGS